MKHIIGDIVKLNRTGELGKLLKYKDQESGVAYFYPADMKSYHEDGLPVVKAKDISGTSVQEKVIYLRMRNTWGNVKETHIINGGEYVIFEVLNSTGKPIFYTSLNFKETARGYESLDSALIGLLAVKYQGLNSQAGAMFERILQMDLFDKKEEA